MGKRLISLYLSWKETFIQKECVLTACTFGLFLASPAIYFLLIETIFYAEDKLKK